MTKDRTGITKAIKHAKEKAARVAHTREDSKKVGVAFGLGYFDGDALLCLLEKIAAGEATGGADEYTAKSLLSALKKEYLHARIADPE